LFGLDHPLGIPLVEDQNVFAEAVRAREVAKEETRKKAALEQEAREAIEKSSPDTPSGASEPDPQAGNV
jgi:hypothetical protein